MKKIDAHVHIDAPISLTQTVEYYKDLMIRKGYDGLGLMSLGFGGESRTAAESNAFALALLKELPGSFAFAALDHSRDFTEQTQEYMQMGFSGIKLLEGKPSVWRHYGYGLDDLRFAPFFAYAEEQQIPLLVHNNDPWVHWDKEKLDERSITSGWYYDETFPKKSYFDGILESVLAQYPRLKIALAHTAFYADRPEKMAELLKKYPNLMMDLTPALGIYKDLSAHSGAVRELILKYPERFFYGTDAHNDLSGFNREYNDKKTAVVFAFLEETELRTVCGMELCPVGLPEKVLEDVYYNNIKRFISD
ncbi:MAG: amidohydrolase family protein [Clostridia bacterium]|nr:amidohydrolase family protein [Clostridia bacterium]